MPRRYSTEERIDRFILNTRRASNGCIEWQGGCYLNGYGRIRTEGRGQEGTHRFAYKLFVGPIPDGLHVLHRCDNPTCVNPTHLFLGTAGDNIRDCVSKGRHVPSGLQGQNHPCAKITDDDVMEIRRRHKDGETPTTLASAFGYSIGGINKIIHRNVWRHLP